MKQFLADVISGLNSNPKQLQSKYFYDKEGDALFQQIMQTPEYYLTNCEMEIFSEQKGAIADVILGEGDIFDYVGFGPGDAIKSTHLMKELFERRGLEIFFPIDISENMVEYLERVIPERIPGLTVHGLAGEYLQMLPETVKTSKNKRLISFLGANIGNFKAEEVPEFLGNLRDSLNEGDLVLIGFDLKKNPFKIMAAYNDATGITAKFNLNLLKRINRELQGDFEIDAFKHYNCYDPDSGACKSYLFSLKDQQVRIGRETFYFKENDTIHMETSHKYSVNEIDDLATSCGFIPVKNFYDKGNMFTDVLWKV